MPERRLLNLRIELARIDQEVGVIDERLFALAEPLTCAREELHRTFAALPGTARAEIVRTSSSGGERARLQWYYASAEQAWNTLASEERRLRTRRTELTLWRHEALMEHRILYQRLRSLRVVAGERDGRENETIRRTG